MNIAFIGDSFCASKNSKAWTELVAAQLGATVLCQGQGGVSIWHSYQQLLAHMDHLQLAVLCYTDEYRLPNPSGYPINLGSVKYHISGQQDPYYQTSFPHKQVWEAAAAYYDHLLVPEYHQLTHRLIIQHMDGLLAARHIRAVHFFSFEHQPLSFASGPCCDQGLWEWLQSCGKTSIAHDSDENHMSWPQNQHVADVVSRLLVSDSRESFALERVRYHR